ncbi:MAG: hypothetical protein R3A79_07600 [Nannocystaceae bacterium]
MRDAAAEVEGALDLDAEQVADEDAETGGGDQIADPGERARAADVCERVGEPRRHEPAAKAATPTTRARSGTSRSTEKKGMTNA